MSEKDKFKFSSSFLKKPFLLNNNNNYNNKFDFDKEELNPNNNEDIKEDIENENTSKISSKINKYDITYSMSEQHRPQTSQFNNENSANKNNNLSISTSTINGKKRKPFENLTFYSEKKNIFNNEFLDKSKEIKDDEESIISDIQFNNKNIDINNPLKESLTELNSSQIPENEKR